MPSRSGVKWAPELMPRAGNGNPGNAKTGWPRLGPAERRLLSPLSPFRSLLRLLFFEKDPMMEARSEDSKIVL
jgi:hypothetical protein